MRRFFVQKEKVIEDDVAEEYADKDRNNGPDQNVPKQLRERCPPEHEIDADAYYGVDQSEYSKTLKEDIFDPEEQQSV